MATAPAELQVSPGLAGDLGEGAPHTVDLARVALSRKYVFTQFELARIERASGCRWLLPLRTGESVRGLLLIKDGSIALPLGSDVVTETLAAVALASATPAA